MPVSYEHYLHICKFSIYTKFALVSKRAVFTLLSHGIKRQNLLCQKMEIEYDNLTCIYILIQTVCVYYSHTADNHTWAFHCQQEGFGSVLQVYILVFASTVWYKSKLQYFSGSFRRIVRVTD